MTEEEIKEKITPFHLEYVALLDENTALVEHRITETQYKLNLEDRSLERIK